MLTWITSKNQSTLVISRNYDELDKMDVISAKTLIYFFIPYRLFIEEKYPIRPKNPNVLIWLRLEDFQKIHKNPRKSKHVDFKGFAKNPLIQKSLRKLQLLDIGLPKNFFCNESLGKLRLLGSFATARKTPLRYVFFIFFRFFRITS